MDVSKQGLGALFAHVLNIMVSTALSWNSSCTDEVTTYTALTAWSLHDCCNAMQSNGKCNAMQSKMQCHNDDDDGDDDDDDDNDDDEGSIAGGCILGV